MQPYSFFQFDVFEDEMKQSKKSRGAQGSVISSALGANTRDALEQISAYDGGGVTADGGTDGGG